MATYSFSVGQKVSVISGRNKGKSGVIRFRSINRGYPAPMYDVELADGHRLDSWESELSPVAVIFSPSDRLKLAIAACTKVAAELREAPAFPQIQALIIEAELAKEALEDMLPESSTLDERDAPNDLINHGFHGDAR